MVLLTNGVGFFIGEFNMLWPSALAIGIVIIGGFMMALKYKKREPVPVSYKVVHIVGTVVGALLALIAAWMGDTRIWMNVVLAVVIVILGLLMAFRIVKKNSAKMVLYAHASIAVICYSLFLYYIFTS